MIKNSPCTGYKNSGLDDPAEQKQTQTALRLNDHCDVVYYNNVFKPLEKV